MGGRKHHLYSQFPFTRNYQDVEDPYERHKKVMSQMQLPFCKYCGKQILDANVDEDNRPVDFEYEMQTGAHYRCELKYRKDQPKPTPEEKPVMSQEELLKLIQEQYGVEVKPGEKE